MAFSRSSTVFSPVVGTLSSGGNEKMQEIVGAIQEGAAAYLNRQYMTIGMVGVVGCHTVFSRDISGDRVFLGAILSGVAGYIGMHISVRANVRTADVARPAVCNRP